MLIGIKEKIGKFISTKVYNKHINNIQYKNDKFLNEMLFFCA